MLKEARGGDSIFSGLRTIERCPARLMIWSEHCLGRSKSFQVMEGLMKNILIHTFRMEVVSIGCCQHLS